jgi:hypothetical protein
MLMALTNNLFKLLIVMVNLGDLKLSKTKEHS